MRSSPTWSSSLPHCDVHPKSWDRNGVMCDLVMLGWDLKCLKCQKVLQRGRLGQVSALNAQTVTVAPDQRVPPRGNAIKPGLSSSQSKAEPAWHLGKLWLSEMTFFKTDTFPLLTSTGAQEGRGHLLPPKSLAPAHKSGSKSASEALADHLSNLAKCPCHSSSSAELLTQLTPFPFSFP